MKIEGINYIKMNSASISLTKIYNFVLQQTCILVKPTVIELPRVKILNEYNDTPNRQFPVATSVQSTCQGEVGSDGSNVGITGFGT